MEKPTWLDSLKTLFGAQPKAPAPNAGSQIAAAMVADLEGAGLPSHVPKADGSADLHSNYAQADAEELAAGITIVDADHTGLSPVAIARANLTTLKPAADMKISQADLDRNINELAKGDVKASVALRKMACVSPVFGDFDPNGASSVFAMVQRAGLSGKDIGTFYGLCHRNPVKALGVLYAKEHFGFGGSGQDVTIKDAVALQGEPGAAPYPVNALLNRVEQALFVKSVLRKTEEFSLGKPKADYEAMLARRAEREAQNQRPKTLLTGKDNIPTAIEKLSGGDEPARRVLAQIASMAQMVDRDSVNGAMGPLTTLDSLGITGERITSLHKACGSHAFASVAVLRARQLGFVSDEQIQKVAAAKPDDNRGGADVRDLDVNGLILQVTEALPNFSYPAALMVGAKPGDASPTASGAGGNPIPSIPAKINSVPRPAPGREKGGVADS